MDKKFSDFGILYVDDEEKSLKYFEAIFEDVAPIYTASSPEAGFEIFTEHHEKIGLVLSDKKMPNESGLSFLQRVRQVNPDPLRILVTAYADLNVAVDALNSGLLYSYLSKPWDPDDLEHRMIKAMNHFRLSRERDQLISEKAEAFDQLLMADKASSIGILSAGLNHHLRNALTVMRTFYDMLPFQLREELGREPEDSSFWNDYYSEVGSQIDRMTSMLTNLAEGARASVLKVDDGIDLPSVFKKASELVLGQETEIEVEYEANELIPNISGDSQKLGQMARFLFQEAKSSLGEEGKIEVRFSSTPAGDVKIIFVDDGQPIPEEQLKHLFDPFFVRSERPEDLGTNMMACYLTTYHHGGSIKARRTRSGLNAIEIVLPLNPQTEERIHRSRKVLSQFAEFDTAAGGMELPA